MIRKNISIVLKKGSCYAAHVSGWRRRYQTRPSSNEIPFKNNQLSCRESRMPSKESKNVPYQRAAPLDDVLEAAKVMTTTDFITRQLFCN
jgi:hypothetical protein